VNAEAAAPAENAIGSADHPELPLQSI